MADTIVSVFVDTHSSYHSILAGVIDVNSIVIVTSIDLLTINRSTLPDEPIGLLISLLEIVSICNYYPN